MYYLCDVLLYLWKRNSPQRQQAKRTMTSGQGIPRVSDLCMDVSYKIR